MEYKIREASQRDFKYIKKLIYSVRINPIGLDWRRFIVATDPEDSILACGQIKRHYDGSRELASIAVCPEHQMKGLGSAVIRHLIEREPPPLYLTCRSQLETYYVRFGFRKVSPVEMAPYFRRIYKLAKLLGNSGLMPTDISVMIRS
ncbi:MAG: N-acetyltransferase [Chloroflexi bacterium]|nr:MAG: N-acetyltransferase [Chloroflexota bacterium]